ncbi:MAG: hypothetical protein M3Z64_04725, partial [Verrucomicrobiota bacterium]|nr:hypothetical protein [Verrucomicrobiota bacterium]
ASVLLGAGRQRTEDDVDFAVGFSAIRKTGEQIETGEPLMFVHARSQAAIDSVLPNLMEGIEIA